ncbi:MAG: hypothetical protein CSA75_02970 [Sorangium cellulosum]|nr:MAG: hypothetical protein CSA75_02970 [Sorangium cellulosum]
MAKAPNNHSNNKSLPIVDSPTLTDGQGCSTCRSNEWIWDEEVELVHKMTAIKSQVRALKDSEKSDAVNELREEFLRLKTRMAKVRRARLDSLGHYDYD